LSLDPPPGPAALCSNPGTLNGQICELPGFAAAKSFGSGCKPG
jgi:hypothetical protein